MTAEPSANWIPHSINDRRSLVSYPLYTRNGDGTTSDPAAVSATSSVKASEPCCRLLRHRRPAGPDGS